MEDACSSASLRELRCEVIGQKQVRGANVLVSVEWVDRAKKKARVRVRSGAGVTRSRTLTFASNDPEVERWRSVGFAIATLVGEDEAQPATPAGAAASERPAPTTMARESAAKGSRAAPRASVRAPGVPTLVGVSLRGGGGLDGALLMGVEARAGWQLGGFLGVSLAAGTTLLGEGTPQHVRGGLTWLAAGAFTPLLQAPRGAVWLRVEALAEQLSIEAERGWDHDGRSQWKPAVRSVIDGELPLRSWLSLEASLELGLRLGETHVVVAGVPTSTLPALRPGVGGGVVARF